MMSLLVGVLVGLVLGLTGAGGSVFAVPLLMALLTLPAPDAIGLSLGAVGISALYGALTKLRSGQIQWLPAAVYAVIGGLVAPLGNWLNKQVDSTLLMTAFASLVLLVATRMWQQALKNPDDAGVVRAASAEELNALGASCRATGGKQFEIRLPCILGVAGGASLTGLLSGLFGVGGGFVIVPTLLALTGISMRQAVATSLVIISVVSMAGFSTYLLGGGALSMPLLMPLALGGLVGMTLGVLVGNRLAGPRLQQSFAVLMILMAIAVLIQQFYS